jgi:hypothetical protein
MAEGRIVKFCDKEASSVGAINVKLSLKSRKKDLCLWQYQIPNHPQSQEMGEGN